MAKNKKTKLVLALDSDLLIPADQAGVELGRVHVTNGEDGRVYEFEVNDDRFEIIDGVLKLRDGVALSAAEISKVKLKITIVGDKKAKVDKIKFKEGPAPQPEPEPEPEPEPKPEPEPRPPPQEEVGTIEQALPAPPIDMEATEETTETDNTLPPIVLRALRPQRSKRF